MLAPFPDFKIRKTFYSAVANPSRINFYDWCSFTIDSLCDTVHRVNGDNCINFVNGCVLLLLVCYCYRCSFQGTPYPKYLPLIQHMNEKHLKSRFEVEKVNGYGKSIMVIDGLPITHQYTDRCKMGFQACEAAGDANLSVKEIPL